MCRCMDVVTDMHLGMCIIYVRISPFSINNQSSVSFCAFLKTRAHYVIIGVNRTTYLQMHVSKISLLHVNVFYHVVPEIQIFPLRLHQNHFQSVWNAKLFVGPQTLLPRVCAPYCLTPPPPSKC